MRTKHDDHIFLGGAKILALSGQILWPMSVTLTFSCKGEWCRPSNARFWQNALRNLHKQRYCRHCARLEDFCSIILVNSFLLYSWDPKASAATKVNLGLKTFLRLWSFKPLQKTSVPEFVLHFPTLTCLFLSLAQKRGGTGAGGGLAGKLEDHWIRPLLCFIETDVMMMLVRMVMMMRICR